ncbi:hypothetical protein [Streptomyces boninensis]|uniref:hypothetical protein n=1 Tax=Streptomyces boninensis TaxID=2039455 RepID=UPI003B226692
MSSSGKVVAALTASALAVVGILAYQAAAAPDPVPAKAGGSSSGSPSPSGSGETGGTDTGAAKRVPAASGKGERVVYSLSGKRVWLVGGNEKIVRSFSVAPSNVSPEPGTYKVQTRSQKVTGSDGVPIEHVVRFANVGAVVIGFSAAVDGSMPKKQAPGMKTGGIRSERADGDAMWKFATVGVPVVVVK